MAAERIVVEGLSKTYPIAGTVGPEDTFRGLVSQMLRDPVGAVRRRSERGRRQLFRALDDVSLGIPDGEVTAVVGRNGAGKSTLLKILSRITEPSSGRALIRGRVASLLEVGTGFHPELTGRENVFVNGAILGMTRREIERRFDEIVAFSGVERFLDTPVKRYSSGMNVRLAFAVAAHLDAEILLVDEVLAVGDAEFQKKCLGRMGEVSRSGRTILFVSHNLNAVEELAGNAVWLEQGRVRDTGRDVRAVVNAYLGLVGGAGVRSDWQAESGGLRTDWLVLRRLDLRDGAGRPVAAAVRSDEGAFLHVEGTVLEPHPALTVGFAIHDEDNHLLFWSLSTDGAEGDRPILEKGDFSLVCRIPGRLLNEGTYRIEGLVCLVMQRWLVGPGAGPSVFLSVRGGLSESEFWYKRRPGILAPVLTWRRHRANGDLTPEAALEARGAAARGR